MEISTLLFGDKMVAKIKLGKQIYSYDFVYENTYRYFQDFIVNEDDVTVQIKKNIPELNRFAKKLSGSDEYIEFNYLINQIGNAMLQFNSMLFHGVAVKIRNSTFLISGPSGVGKSTQYKNLLQKYGNEIVIINGDKPLLDLNDNKIQVYPSPWNGKEGWRSQETGSLTGIIYLAQADENKLSIMSSYDAALLIFRQVLYVPYNTTLIRQASALAEKLLNSVPVWLYINKGDVDSSIHLYDKLKGYMEADDE